MIAQEDAHERRSSSTALAGEYLRPEATTISLQQVVHLPLEPSTLHPSRNLADDLERAYAEDCTLTKVSVVRQPFQLSVTAAF